MESFPNQVTQKLMEVSSRRRFTRKVGEVVATLAALTVGRFLWSNETAHADDMQCTLHCCEGTVCSVVNICPANTIPFYTWSCLDSHNHRNYICTDCFQLIETTPYKIYQYFCSLASYVPASQTEQAAINTSMRCQSSKANIVLE
jgi:hypothetical protein